MAPRVALMCLVVCPLQPHSFILADNLQVSLRSDRARAAAWSPAITSLLSPYAQKSCREGRPSEPKVPKSCNFLERNTRKRQNCQNCSRPAQKRATLHSGSDLRPLEGSRGALPVDPSGYWEELRHGRLGTHHVLGVDMVCAASKALAERAERARSKFSAKGFKSAKTFALLPRAAAPQEPREGAAGHPWRLHARAGRRWGVCGASRRGRGDLQHGLNVLGLGHS